MIDINALSYGAAGSVIGAIICYISVKTYKNVTRKNVISQIETIELEKQCLESMNESSVEMNRRSFLGIFYVFSVISIANCIPHALELYNSKGYDLLTNISNLVTIILWCVAFMISSIFYKKYQKLKNYTEEFSKLENQIQNLKNKLEN